MTSVCDYAGHTTFLYILMYRETKESNLRLLLHLDPVWFVFLAASFYISWTGTQVVEGDPLLRG